MNFFKHGLKQVNRGESDKRKKKKPGKIKRQTDKILVKMHLKKKKKNPKFKARKVRCHREADGDVECTDDDKNNFRCRKNGRNWDCTDNDNVRRVCRRRKNGYLTCSDNDRWDWDTEAAATQQFGWW